MTGYLPRYFLKTTVCWRLNVGSDERFLVVDLDFNADRGVACTLSPTLIWIDIQ